MYESLEKKTNNERNMLLGEYGLNEKAYSLIIKHYGSIDAFRKIYIKAFINQNIDEVINKDIIENSNLIRGFDLSSPDWIQRNRDLIEQMQDVLARKNVFINYNDIIEDSLTEREKQTVSMLYGLNNVKNLCKLK